MRPSATADLDRETDLALRQFDADLGLVVLDQPLHLADGLARHDHAGHAGCALRQRQISIVKRILPCDSSMPTSASLSSINRCTSPTVLRGTITPGMPDAPFGNGRSRS